MILNINAALFFSKTCDHQAWSFYLKRFITSRGDIVNALTVNCVVKTRLSMTKFKFGSDLGEQSDL